MLSNPATEITYSARNIYIRVYFANLLPDRMVRPVKNSAAEKDGFVCLEILGSDGGYLELQLRLLAHYDGVELIVVVHDIQVGDTGN